MLLTGPGPAGCPSGQQARPSARRGAPQVQQEPPTHTPRSALNDALDVGLRVPRWAIVSCTSRSCDLPLTAHRRSSFHPRHLHTLNNFFPPSLSPFPTLTTCFGVTRQAEHLPGGQKQRLLSIRTRPTIAESLSSLKPSPASGVLPLQIRRSSSSLRFASPFFASQSDLKPRSPSTITRASLRLPSFVYRGHQRRTRAP